MVRKQWRGWLDRIRPSSVAVLMAALMLGGVGAANAAAQQRLPWSGGQSVRPPTMTPGSGSSQPQRIRPSFSPPVTPSPQPSPGGGHHGGHDGHHHHRYPYGYPYAYPYGLYGYSYGLYGYPSYGVPYAVYCPSCGRANCYDPYCLDRTTYYVLPPRVTVTWPWGNEVYDYAAQPWQGGGGWTTPGLNFPAAAAAAARAAAAPALPAVPGGDAGRGVVVGDAGRDEILRRTAALRPSTAEGRQRADRALSEGDRIFADQNYRRAAAKYRDAIAKAPDYPEPHLRAGHAYVATGDHELALTYFLIGLQLAGRIERPGFALDDLYRGNRIAKEQHLSALNDAALRQPEDGGLPFLTGVTLHFDGQPLQARPYFERAAQMPGAQQHYAQMFLPLVPVADAAP